MREVLLLEQEGLCFIRKFWRKFRRFALTLTKSIPLLVLYAVATSCSFFSQALRSEQHGLTGSHPKAITSMNRMHPTKKQVTLHSTTTCGVIVTFFIAFRGSAIENLSVQGT